MSPLHRLALIGAALAALVATATCRRNLDPPGRVVIIGIDGAAPHLVKVWRKQGMLPNLERLAREGASGRIATDPVILSPRIWTTVATGKTAEVHGITSWVHTEGPHKGRMFRSFHRRGHALWNIASDHGLKVGVVNWLMTHPPEKVDGVMISDFNVPGQRRGRGVLAGKFGRDAERDGGFAETAATTWPLDWEARTRDLAASPPALLLGQEGTRWRQAKWLPELAKKVHFADDLAARIALAIEAEESPELLMVLLQGIDRVSHFSWAGVAPREAYPEGFRRRDKVRRLMHDLMLDYYVYSDRLIGRLLERYGQNDLVIVLSDHGFEPTFKSHGITGGHESEAAGHGVVFMRGPGIEAGRRIERMAVGDVTPAVLAWLGLGVAGDMSGRIPDFLDVEPAPPVKTYRGEIERVETTAQDGEAELLEQLRSLGYIN